MEGSEKKKMSVRGCLCSECSTKQSTDPLGQDRPMPATSL